MLASFALTPSWRPCFSSHSMSGATSREKRRCFSAVASQRVRKRMSCQDISREIEDLYAFSVSTATISAVTDKVIPELKQWQQRPLEKVYPFVWLDAIHYKVREDGRYQSKAVYTVLALDLEGRKEVLGLYLSKVKAQTSGCRY
ncbi:Transposase for insertion sequence element ISRM3 [Salmonella enterica subsp. arizonae]|uniref:Mutator family transposase n=1 Tax=Salmonella enterica subsp. arizonae TaxID=59203 RepID=A0A379T2Q2_SALER|nr:Transposase for insertion sequence element ISRM3 [Salmonella enterica subsp. arizonae]SUG44942.1 Transposase for insertion sequence element ISRM3 [Salmonella enterica subsp. arizonae]